MSSQHRIQYLAHSGLSPECSADCLDAEKLWQESIDTIVSVNFPNEYGKYKAVVWEEDFDNAWVVKGRQINITKRFLYKLSGTLRKCVAAHELAHLKMGHYYARSGIIILDNPDIGQIGNNPLRVGHYGQTLNLEVPKGFGENQEEEADRLALAYIERAGIGRSSYLELLLRLRGGDYEVKSAMAERIQRIRKIINSEDLLF